MHNAIFAPGQTYTNEASANAPYALFIFEVIGRSNKCLTIQEPGHKPRRVKVKTKNGVEYVSKTNRVIQFHTFADNR